MALDSLGAFMEQAGRYELLTTDEEIHLSRRIQRWRELKDKEGELTKEERRAIKSGLRARERLVKCNLRLVVHVSKKYTFKLRGFAMEHADLIQEGMFGLQRAAELFDGTKGYKFSTYAYWWIRQSISRSLETYDRCVRIPTNCLQKLNKAKKIQNEYMQEHGKPASLEYIAKEISMDVDLLRLSIERSTYHTSLDSLLIDNGTTLLDLMHTDEDLYDNADQKFEYDKLSQALATLNDADYELIQRIYGLDDAPIETMREIAGKKSYCRERVRQRRNAAINRLANALRRSSPLSSTEQMSLIQ
jgi:RNA polymerase sigma factor (sigma-70 family)